ncbi:hypothetical protein [Citrobacter braakii]|uniref:hypothetical protein n=1 Tax=Citrobacter braakii TaxID=57706 RepID=UPI000CEE6348|nr:hypothetical protein [Citrobacter braakii]PPS50418.1 hypothetical protein BWR12_13400 [Citrobacter braakii]
MNEFIKKLTSLVLPFWMDKGEPAKLLIICRRFWKDVYGWITWPLNQYDPLTCAEFILNLIAYDRDITRFSNEPLSLFRKRVAYAFINASDAGSVNGFINIFERLGIGYLEVLERQAGIDWDIIILRVTDTQISQNAELFSNIIRQYGRTCRRYQFEVLTKVSLSIIPGSFDGDYVCFAAPVVRTEIKAGEYIVYPSKKLTNSAATYGAKL